MGSFEEYAAAIQIVKTTIQSSLMIRVGSDSIAAGMLSDFNLCCKKTRGNGHLGIGSGNSLKRIEITFPDSEEKFGRNDHARHFTTTGGLSRSCFGACLRSRVDRV